MCERQFVNLFLKVYSAQMQVSMRDSWLGSKIVMAIGFQIILEQNDPAEILLRLSDKTRTGIGSLKTVLNSICV